MRRDDALWIGAGILAFGGLGFLIKKKAMGGTNYLGKIAAAASPVAKESGIPISYIVAQAVHESRGGASGLAQKSNNLFGIKAGRNWVGAVDLYPTKEFINGKEVTVNAEFRKYSTWEASVRDWLKFIKARYPAAFGKALAHDAKGFFEELQKGGYATDPLYATKLVSVLESIKEAVV